jgi:hypothetical protein
MIVYHSVYVRQAGLSSIRGSVKVEIMGMWWNGGVEAAVTKRLPAGIARINSRGRRADQGEES